MKLVKAAVFCVMAATQSAAIADTTYDVEEFAYGGIEFGMTVDEVVEVLTSKYAIGRDDLAFKRVDELIKETGDTNLIWRIRYETEDWSIVVSMYPDLDLIDDGDYMVVSKFNYGDFNYPELNQVVANAEEEFGPHSVMLGTSKFPEYHWCTKIENSSSGRASCDESYASLVISRYGRLFYTPFYQQKYFGTQPD